MKGSARNLWTAVVPALLLLAGCGAPVKKEKQSPVAPSPPPVLSSDAFASPYPLADQDCQQAEGLDVVDDVSVHLWQGSRTSLAPFHFEDATSTESLSNGLIAASHFGFHQRRRCTAEDGVTDCATKAEVVEKRRPLKICQTAKAHGRETVEGVALTSLANLTAAFEYYLTLDGDPGIQKTTLLVLPKIETVVTKAPESGGDSADGEVEKRSVTTDNLAYTPYFNGQPAFLIFPKGKGAARAGLWSDVNLWEIPWALAHEFGHHVFKTHTGISGLESLTIHSFGEPTPAETAREFGLTTRAVGASDVWSAVNEAFADLFAYYALGAEPGLVDGVDCFETDRDVARGHFSNGRSKALDREAVDEFFSTVTTPKKGCGVPHFQDIHTVGAVIAHGLDRLMSETVGDDTGAAAARAKAGLLLQWADRLETIVKEEESSDVGFSELLRPMLDLLAEEESLSKDHCRIVREFFPVFGEQWFEGGAFGCTGG